MNNPEDLPYHPYVELFPKLSDEEKNELADDIKLNGLIHPIITFKGHVLDGRNRYQACLSVDVKPQFKEYSGSDPLAFVISANLN